MGSWRWNKLSDNTYDIRFVWARIHDQWVQLNTIDPLVRECYDQGIQQAHLEVYGRSKTQIRAYQTGKARPLPRHTNLHEQEKALFSVENAAGKNAIKADTADLSTVDIDLTQIKPYNAIRQEA